jgi:hypothetical protein
MTWLALPVYSAVRSSRAAPTEWMTVACLLGALTLPNLTANAADDGNQMPRYDHVLVIIAENQAYEDIIGKLDVSHESLGILTRTGNLQTVSSASRPCPD